MVLKAFRCVCLGGGGELCVHKVGRRLLVSALALLVCGCMGQIVEHGHTAVVSQRTPKSTGAKALLKNTHTHTHTVTHTHT